MADLFAQRALIPAPMRVDGNSVQIIDKYVLTATNPAAADVILFRIPAGSYVARLRFIFDDIDSGTASLIGVGYRAVDSSSALAASAAYFAAAGQTTGQAGGALECAFKPIKFEEDVFVTITIGTAGAGTNTGDEIWMIATVNQVGPK